MVGLHEETKVFIVLWVLITAIVVLMFYGQIGAEYINLEDRQVEHTMEEFYKNAGIAIGVGIFLILFVEAGIRIEKQGKKL